MVGAVIAAIALLERPPADVELANALETMPTAILTPERAAPPVAAPAAPVVIPTATMMPGVPSPALPVAAPAPAPAPAVMVMPTATALPTPTRTPERAAPAPPPSVVKPTATALPTPTRTPLPVAPPVAVAAPVVAPPTHTATALPTATVTPVPVPTTNPSVIASLLENPWKRGKREGRDEEFSQSMNHLVVSNDGSTIYAYTTGGGRESLWRSTDGGRDWSRGGLLDVSGLEYDIIDFAVDPEDPNSIYALTRGLSYHSTDGGETWVKIQVPPGSKSLVKSSKYLLVAEDNGMVFRSSDNGESWREIGSTGPTYVNFLTIPSHPDYLFAYSTSEGPHIGYVSYDSGIEWSPVPDGPQGDRRAWSFGSYDNRFGITLTNPLTIYATISGGDFDIDLGNVFKADATNPTEWIPAFKENVSGRNITIHPNDPDVFVVRSHSHIILATSDGGQSWIPLHQAGYQVGNTIYSELPSVGGSRGTPPQVIANGDPWTICIGTNTGVWCHRGLDED